MLVNFGDKTTFTVGDKHFELTNHLGNVLATVSDKIIPVKNSTGSVAYFEADVVTANDYYAFGMITPGRRFAQGSSGYRFGFNGKENDKDAGEGIQDYGMRILDNRLGKFLSVDPLTKNYPELTPYQFASNTPIQAIDLDGAESKIVTQFYWKNSSGTQLSTTKIETLKTPGPLGEGILFYTKIDNVTNQSPRNTGNIVYEFRYVPSADEIKTFSIWDNFWRNLRKGGDNHDRGSGAGSTQEFGIIFTTTDNGLGSTKTGGGADAKNFEVQDYGLFGLITGTGGRLTVSDLAKDPEKLLHSITKGIEELASGAATGVNAFLETKKLLNDQNGIPSTIKPSTKKDASKSFVFRRLDEYGHGPGREKKKSIQNHAYATDTTIRHIPAKDGSGVDTFEIKQNK